MSPHTSFPAAATSVVERDVSVDPRRVREAVRKLQGLPASYPILQEALRMTEDPLCSFQELDRVLSVEPSLCAQLLRLANSAFYAVRSEVTTISRAVTVVGQVKLRMLLFQMFVAGLFHHLAGKDPLADEIWEDSIAAAAACKSVGEFLPFVESDEVLVGGLLHNIGDFVLLSQFREQYAWAVRNTAGKDRYAVQAQVFGVDARRVGRWLLEAWRLPAMLGQAAEHWERPFDADVDVPGREFLAMVHVGVVMGLGWRRRRGFEQIVERIDNEALRLTSLDLGTLENVYGELDQPAAQVHHLRDMFSYAA